MISLNLHLLHSFKSQSRNALRNDLRNAACCIIENVINRRLITELMRK